MKTLFKKLKTIWWRVKSLFAMYYYGYPSKKLKIIGVTGTNGKTTIATLLYRVSTALGYKTGLIGTVENIIVDEKRDATHTTPDSISLTKLLKEMVDRGCEYVFMEVSSHALDQGRVKWVNFSGAIFTNLTHDHLDYHKDFDNYFKAKKKLFEMLPPTSFALSNIDDGYGLAMTENIKAKVYTYGLGENTEILDFYGKIQGIDFNGLYIDINGEEMHVNLLGKFNAYNLLAVWGASSLLNFDIEKVKNILENIKPPRGRFEHFTNKDGVTVIVDYAHSPDALDNVLQTILEIKPETSRIISVFGCGGDRDPVKRSKMGKIGAALSDITIFTSDNPRSEDPNKIIEQMRSELSHEEAQKVVSIVDRKLAIAESLELARPGDIILCAGKGHETYQDIKGVKHHFDDLEEYKAIRN